MKSKDKYNLHYFPQIDEQGKQGRHDPSDGQDPMTQPLEHQLRVLENEAYEEGYAQGRDQTLETQTSKIVPLGELLGQAKASLAEHQLRIRKTAEQDMVHVALSLARHIVQHEIRRQPTLSAQIVRQSLQLASTRERIMVKAHPADCETVRTLLQEMVPHANGNSQVQVTSDRTIQKGGCLIETDFGVIDARVRQQLTAIATTLSSALMESGSVPAGEPGTVMTFEHCRRKVEAAIPIKVYGHVTKVVGLVVEANGPLVQLGCMCDIFGNDNDPPITAEVLGFRDRTVLMMPLEEIRTIAPGSRVVARAEKASVAVGNSLLGRVIDGLGHPIDGHGPLAVETEYSIYANPINPLLRQRIRTPLDLGVRAINGLLTVGCGQRMGIFAGSGVGKSVLMGMIARKSKADVNVIALIGERGRELNEFIDKELGADGLKKSVVVVATSDHLPLVRVRGAFVATAIAEYFRDQGLQVNLMMDSLTRFAMAQREIGLALGEPPTTKGYTPSVFTLMPKLLERAGTSDHAGTITGLYTVLVEGDDMNEPIADSARSILDGHIVLTRELADQNHYPAIDVLRSISRVMEDIAGLQHKHNSGRLKEMLATYRKVEDLVNIGAYVSGSNKAIDRAIAKIDQISAYLRQDMQESVSLEQSLQQLEKMMNTP